jgi:hypothetical protein
MSNYSSDNEVYGANFFTGAVIAGSVFVLLAFFAGLSPQMGKLADATSVANAPAAEVVVVTAPRHGKDS